MYSVYIIIIILMFRECKYHRSINNIAHHNYTNNIIIILYNVYTEHNMCNIYVHIMQHTAVCVIHIIVYYYI